MVRKSSPRLTKRHIRRVEREFMPVEADFAYWAEHVLHWHALLLVVVSILALGYFSR